MIIHKNGFPTTYKFTLIKNPRIENLKKYYTIIKLIFECTNRICRSVYLDLKTNNRVSLPSLKCCIMVEIAMIDQFFYIYKPHLPVYNNFCIIKLLRKETLSCSYHIHSIEPHFWPLVDVQ